MDMSPTDVGYKFRSLALANCPTNSNLSRLVLKLWDTSVWALARQSNFLRLTLRPG